METHSTPMENTGTYFKKENVFVIHTEPKCVSGCNGRADTLMCQICDYNFMKWIRLNGY